MHKKRVLVAMSGGIDSSLAAIMLHEQGYEIVGITMKTWSYKNTPSSSSGKIHGCCNLDSINDARNVATHLGFHHYVLDLTEEFSQHVVNDFVQEYLNGRTPNPCIKCNTFIKWKALLQRANKLECEFIATGHYAKVKHENDRYFISKGIDSTKDQSYVLFELSQDFLKRTIFPLGGFTKKEIKKIAKKRGFKELVEKPESYEICFIPNNDYRDFLRKEVKGFNEKVKEGNFILKDGTVVGQHKGYPFYTIGQRKGLGIALGYPAYVIDIKTHQNEVVIGKEEDLLFNSLYARNLTMSKYENINTAMELTTKIRYNDIGTISTVYPVDNKTGKCKINFKHNVKAITPGQAAVFYEGDDIVGGGG